MPRRCKHQKIRGVSGATQHSYNNFMTSGKNFLKKDFLFIENMRVACRIGTTAEERAFPQILSISLRLETCLEQAAKSDSLDNTVDYASIIESIRSICQSNVFTLAESLAGKIAEEALRHPMSTAVEVRVGKKVFLDIESVGASIYRVKQG